MNPGRELDILVAEKVMGLPYWIDKRLPLTTELIARESARLMVPDFSTDIAAAWLVVEKLQTLEQWGTFRIQREYNRKWNVGWKWSDMGASGCECESIEESAPHAICLAALKAVGHDAT